ncbi:hypothetical protein AB5I41_15300 [Sphingomonas sp. MMS24-JH45]
MLAVALLGLASASVAPPLLTDRMIGGAARFARASSMMAAAAELPAAVGRSRSCWAIGLWLGWRRLQPDDPVRRWRSWVAVAWPAARRRPGGRDTALPVAASP